MGIYTTQFSRSIPPQPTVAWFVRDLVPDELWDQFDIGAARAGEIDAVRRALIYHGGAQAWLRFVGETRAALPQILSDSLFNTIERALGTARVWPNEIRLDCHPVLSAFLAGRLVNPRVTLHCRVRLIFRDAGEPRSNDHAVVTSEISLSQRDECLLEKVSGEYFVPVPPPRPTGLEVRRMPPWQTLRAVRGRWIGRAKRR